MKTLLFILFLAISVSGQNISTDALFFGNSSTNLYYPKECSEAARIPAAYRTAFYSQKEAEEKGFQPAEKCTRQKASFESVPNVAVVQNAPSSNSNGGVNQSEKPARIAGRRIKRLAQINDNLAAFLNQVIVITASVKVGGYYGSYLNKDELVDPFEIVDGTMPDSSGVFVYMTHGELSDDLCRRISTSKNERLSGTFTFRITGETFWQRTGERAGLLGDLLEYELSEESR